MSESAAGGVAVVTGGTGALGRWVVRALVDIGMRVWVPWVAKEEADALAASLEGREGALHHRETDVTDAPAVEAFFAGVGQGARRLDVLCNVAGGFVMAPVEATEPGAWERMMALNATSAFLCCRSAVPLMRAGGGGRIVNVAALPAVDRGAAGMSAYAASKAAVLSLTHSLAKELRADGITVNAVAPETLDTPANRRGMPEGDPTRWLHPDEVARVIRFLAGTEGGAVTGSVLLLGRVGGARAGGAA